MDGEDQVGIKPMHVHGEGFADDGSDPHACMRGYGVFLCRTAAAAAQVDRAHNLQLATVALASAALASFATHQYTTTRETVGIVAGELLFNKLAGFKRTEDAEAFQQVSTSAVREYWDGRPCNSGWKFDGIEYGSKAHWEEVTRRKYKVEYHIPAWAEFDRWKGKRVLEVGGGICTTATSFAKAGAFITVADLSPKSMEMCKERFKVMELEHMANFYVVNAEELSSVIPVEEYDLIWSFGVIHHSPNPGAIINQIKQYMGQHTVLKLMVYSKISMKLFWVMNHTRSWEFSHMDELVAHYSEAREGSPVTYTYSMQGAKDLMEGFTVTYIGKTHIFPYQITDYRKNRYVVEPYLRDLTSHRWAELEDELGWHLLIEGRLPQVQDPSDDDAPVPVCHGRFKGMRGLLPG